MNARIRTITSLGTVALVFSALLGCGASDDGEFAEDVAALDSGLDSGLSDTGEQAPAGRNYWGWVGQITLTDGALDLEASELRIRRSSEERACEIPGVVESQTELDVTAEEDMIIRWQVDLTLESVTGCPWEDTTQFVVGFGVPQPSLDAPGARLGLSVETSYGLYVSSAEDTLLVGLAGTPDQLDGSSGIDYAVRPADGTYTLHTMYGLPILEP